MGFTPAEVDAMSVWEFRACIAGYAEAHGTKKGRHHGAAEIDDTRLRAMGIKGF